MPRNTLNHSVNMYAELVKGSVTFLQSVTFSLWDIHMFMVERHLPLPGIFVFLQHSTIHINSEVTALNSMELTPKLSEYRIAARQLNPLEGL